MIDVYQDNSIGSIRIPVRAPATPKECVQIVADKSYIRHPLRVTRRQIAFSGGQSINHRRYLQRGADL